MLSFLASVLAEGIDPVSLASGLAIGYLFHKDWNQLAWPLLVFIVPGIGGLNSSVHTHGALYVGAAQFIAVCLLAFGFYYGLEQFTNRRRTNKP